LTFVIAADETGTDEIITTNIGDATTGDIFIAQEKLLSW